MGPQQLCQELIGSIELKLKDTVSISEALGYYQEEAIFYLSNV
jgi:hypothetical protein